MVSEGFGSAMMLKEFFSDSMIQIFLPKTAEKLENPVGLCGAALRGFGGDFEPHHRIELIEIRILAGPPHDPTHQNPKNRSPLCPKSVGFRGLVAIRSEVPPKGAAGAPSGKSAHIYHGSEDHAYDHNKHFFTLHEEEQRTRAQTKALARPPVKRVAQQHLFPT